MLAIQSEVDNGFSLVAANFLCCQRTLSTGGFVFPGLSHFFAEYSNYSNFEQNILQAQEDARCHRTCQENTQYQKDQLHDRRLTALLTQNKFL